MDDVWKFLDQSLVGCDSVSVQTILEEYPGIVNYQVGESTPLHRAVMECGDDSIVDMLLGVPGIDLSIQDCDGDTAFHLAVAQGRVTLAKKMLDTNPAVISIPDRNGEYPLHYACEEIRMLMIFFSGSNAEHTKTIINMRNKDGYTPLELACRYRTKMAVLFLIKNGAEITKNKMYRERISKYIRLFKIVRSARRVRRKLF